MRIAFLMNTSTAYLKLIEEFCGNLNMKGMQEVETISILCEEKEDIVHKVKEAAPDILVVTDLFGFTQSTLTDNLALNLLDCKQVHLLISDWIPNESMLEKQLSIAMFFYCRSELYMEELREKYPNLPCLKLLDGWQVEGGHEKDVSNAEILSSVICEVAAECGLL